MGRDGTSARDRANLVAISAVGAQLLRDDSDVDEALALVTDRTRDLLDADVVLWWPDPVDRAAFPVAQAWTDERHSTSGERHTADERVLTTLRTGVPSLVHSTGTRRLLAPVEVLARRAGVLDVTATEEREDFDASDLAVAMALCERLGSALTAKQLRDELQHRADHDELTGLPNRALLRAYLTRMLAIAPTGSQSPAVIFVDVDRFKLVNDSLGHAFGDRVLVSTAQRLRSLVRKQDFVARFGGDEFVVVLDHGVSIEELRVLLDRLTDASPDSVEVDGERLYVTLSAGLAQRTSDDDADTMLRHADAAMYNAKLSTSHRWAEFTRPLLDASVASLRGERELREAIDNEELFCEFQPIVDLETMQPVAHEALVRWQHPTLARRPPSDFIPLAEDSRLIVPLTDLVLRQAVTAMSAWPGAAAVSVNLSARHLADPALVTRILSTLDELQCAPARLIVEITETAVMADPEGAATNLRALHSVGVRIAIDDFGTGYTSIEQLLRLPVDLLKLDRAFIAQAVSLRGGSMFEALMSLARVLDITAIAEGVETSAELATVMGSGCTLAQGFLLGRPVPEELVSHDVVTVTGAAGTGPS